MIRLPDRSGTIQICSALAGQVPQLSKQLADAARTLGSQQVQITELTRLIRGMNDAGRSLGPDRQSQMLKSLSAELARSQRGGDDRTRQSIELLGQQFEDLRGQMASALADRTTAAATQAGLQGPVGDSIARLELASASRQLDEINARLAALQGQVGDVKSDTQAMRRQLETIARQSEADAARAAAADQQFQAMRRQINERPEAVGHLNLARPMRTPGAAGAWNLALNLSLVKAAWQDASLLLIGRPVGGNAWVIDASSQLDPRQAAGTQSVRGTLLGAVPDLTVCFAVLDPVRAQRVTLSQTFTAQGEGAMGSYRALAPMRIDLEPPPECSARGLRTASFVQFTGLEVADGYVNIQKTIYRNSQLRGGLWLMSFLVAKPSWRAPFPAASQFLAVWSRGHTLLRAIDFTGLALSPGADVRFLSDIVAPELSICVVGPHPRDPSQLVRYVESFNVSVAQSRPGFDQAMLERAEPARLQPVNEPVPLCDAAQARASKAQPAPL